MSELKELISSITQCEEKNIKAERKFFELVVFYLINEDPFYGHFLVGAGKKFNYNDIAAISLNVNEINFWFNIKRMFKEKFTLDNIIAVVKHEILHLVNKHLSKREKFSYKYSHDTLNVVMDVAINQYIDNLPGNAFTLEIFKKQAVMANPSLRERDIEERREFEYYLTFLPIDSINYIAGQMMKGLKGPDGTEGKGLPIDSHADWDRLSDETKDTMKSIENVVKRYSKEAVAKARGNLPDYMKDMIDKLMIPPALNWKKELRSSLGSIPVPYRKTILKRNRRQPQRLDLKGRISDRLLNVVVAVDTSGSMSEKEIAEAFSNIDNILRSTKIELTVIQCDAAIQEIKKVKSLTGKKINVKGRGGTSFSPVIEYLNTRNKVDLLIFFTDGGGECQLTQRPKYRIFWIITGGEGTKRKPYISLEKTYGRVLPIKPDNS